MDLQFISVQNLFIFLPFLYMIVKLVTTSKTRKLPPGPWRLPLIGNMHQLFGSLPHHILRDLAKKHGPLMYLQLGEISSIVISSPEIAKEVLIKKDNIFCHRPFLFCYNTLSYNSRDIAFAPYGSYWRQLRKICNTELLSAKRVQSFRSIRVEEVSNLVKVVASSEKSPINLTEKISLLMYGVTSRAAFGSKCKDRDSSAYISYLNEFVRLASGFSLVDVYPSNKVLPVITGMKRKVEKLFRGSDRVIQGILDEHKQRISLEKKNEVPRAEHDDLLTTLLQVQENGDMEIPLTDIHIKAVLWDVFSAGVEASSTTMDWAMAELVRTPRAMEKAQMEVRTIYDRKGKVDEESIHEMRYLKAVINETFRLHPPGTLSLPRESSEDCEVNGFEIPAKTKVFVNVWAMGRDPNYWSDAERFLPERFLDSTTDFRRANLEFIPFGAGRRMCTGISFALPNIELPLAQLLYHFDWKLPDGVTELDMSEAYGSAVRRKDDLMLVPTACKHSHSI